MKRIFWSAVAFLAFGPVLAFGASSGSGAVIEKSAQAIPFTYDMDVSDYERFSLQVEIASSALSAASLSDGAFSSVTLTVASYDGLIGRASSSTITLADGSNTSVISGASIKLGGAYFVEGDHWHLLATSTMTMNSLKLAIDAHDGFTATVSSNIVTAKSATIGTSGNSLTITSSKPSNLVVTAWGAGQAPGTLRVNGTTLTEGVDFTAATSSDTTANAIEEAFNANSALSAIAVATNSAMGIVVLTAKTAGVNAYPVGTSNASHLAATSNRFEAGAASAVSVADNTFSKTAHGFGEATPLLYQTLTGTVPTGLTTETTYYAIRTSADLFKVSVGSSTAGAGAALDITAVIGGGTFSFTPLAFSAGSAGYDLQGSNDGSVFRSIAGATLGISTVTYAAHGGVLFHFPNYSHKFLRLKFVPPAAGGINLTGTLFYRKED